MNCPHCVKANYGLWHEFNTACKGCRAREVARSQPFFYSARTGKQLHPYRVLMRDAELTHDDVLAAVRDDHDPGR